MHTSSDLFWLPDLESHYGKITISWIDGTPWSLQLWWTSWVLVQRSRNCLGAVHTSILVDTGEAPIFLASLHRLRRKICMLWTKRRSVCNYITINLNLNRNLPIYQSEPGNYFWSSSVILWLLDCDVADMTEKWISETLHLENILQS